ncbi:hypothetical protein DL93DRAFT_2076274 [Clavulina sp. PMI_390]|nr:hypothetical protein DL93DRAFT_2076274 [Clavulina sp. PMI_390]
MLAMRTMVCWEMFLDVGTTSKLICSKFRFMPNLAKIIVEANQTLTYAVLAPILPIPNGLQLARSLHTVDVRFVGNCDEVGQLRALAGFIRDIVLGRHAIDSAIQVTLPICLQNKLEVGRLPPNSVTGWHEECKCGRCYM